MTFDSDLEPAKPSAVILEIIRKAIESKNLVVNTDNDVSPFIMVNKSVRNDIDDFVQRYHENGGSTISKTDFVSTTDKKEYNDCPDCLTQPVQGMSTVTNVLCSRHFNKHTEEVASAFGDKEERNRP